MFMNRGSSLVSTILAVAAAGGVGVAGYYLVSGGCGSCSTDTSAAATPVAAAATDAEAGSCCPGDVAAADAVLVANEGEACESSCSDAEKAACETVCTDEMKADCATECSGEAAVELVANEGEACSAAKSDCSTEKACDGEAADVMLVTNEAEGECEKSCEGEAKVCPITGQPIADAGN